MKRINICTLESLIFIVLFFLMPEKTLSQDGDFDLQKRQINKLLYFNIDSAEIAIHQLDRQLENTQSQLKKLELELLHVKLLFEQGAFKESIDKGEDLLSKCTKIQNPRLELDVSLTLGRCYKYGGIKPRQFELNQRIFHLAYILKDTSAVIRALHSTGDIHRNSNNDERCYKYNMQAYRIAKLTQKTEDLADCNRYIGTYHIWKTKDDSSILYLNKARLGYEKLNQRNHQSVSWIRMCRAYIYEQEMDSAEYCIKQAIAISKKLNSKLWLGRSYIQYGRVIQKTRDFETALKYYDSAHFNLEKAQDLIVLNGAYQQKSRMFNNLGYPDSALIYFKKHVRLKDSIKKRKSYEEIVNMEWQMDADKKEKRISFLKEKSKILDSKNRAERRSRTWLTTALITLGILTILVYQLFKQRNKSLSQEKKLRSLDQANAKLELELKNRELTTLSMEISSKSQDIKDIHAKIKELEETIKPDSKLEMNMLKELRGISRQLKTEASKEKEWQQFKLQFEQVHGSFFDKLKQNHPTLTAYDLKLCAYFHMNLGIKQVANILNVSYDAVKKQRTRMRKKMNLNPETNLLIYLNKMSS